MRGALELADDFMRRGYVDLTLCDELEDDYQAVILRFFEGDVPMMICTGDTETQYYCFPKGPVPVAKARLAAEELYKLCRRSKP